MAHSALGLVKFKCGDMVGSLREFETAERIEPSPDPALEYRLGSLYVVRRDSSRAVIEFQKAASSNDAVISRLARAQLKNLLSMPANLP
jgi:hypothetical protein